MMGVLPFHTSFGMTFIVLAGIMLGSTVLVVPKFELRSFFSYIEKYKVTLPYWVVYVGKCRHWEVVRKLEMAPFLSEK